MEKDLQTIKELETELVKLRLKTRHVDFIKDYDRKSYFSQNQKKQPEIQHEVIQFLKKQNTPITNAEIIHELIKSMEGLSEKDFEKTGSGSIRIHSGIRTAIVNLTRNKVVTIKPRGHIILTAKLQQNPEK